MEDVDVEEVSDAFAQTPDALVDVVHAGHDTPRAVERFQSRIHYLAVLKDRLMENDAPRGGLPKRCDPSDKTIAVLASVAAYDESLLLNVETNVSNLLERKDGCLAEDERRILGPSLRASRVDATRAVVARFENMS